MRFISHHIRYILVYNKAINLADLWNCRFLSYLYETLPHILLSNASLVTKSCIARFVEGDAFNPSALSDCNTGPSPPLAHAKSTLSPSRASAGCLQPGLFGRFRSICEQTAHPSRKIRAQCEIPHFHAL